MVKDRFAGVPLQTCGLEIFKAEAARLDCTVTAWVDVFVLPAASVMVQVTVVVPKANVAGALLLTTAPGQLSEETGVPRLTPVAMQPTALAAWVLGAGAVMFGACVSLTVTVKVQLAVKLAMSVMVAFTVVRPLLKTVLLRVE